MGVDRSEPSSMPAMPLAMALVGQTVVFVKASGGYGLTQRLAELGLTPGGKLEIINRGPGPFIISVKGARLVPRPAAAEAKADALPVGGGNQYVRLALPARAKALWSNEGRN